MKFWTLIVAIGLCLISPCRVDATDPADINCAADIAGCCCRGVRGNVDCDIDDRVDIVDLTLLIDYLFVSFDPLPSVDEANIDGEALVDISDLTRLINYLYCGGAPPPSCSTAVNHPPQTTLLSVSQSIPYFNSKSPSYGLPFSWSGEDRFDHPYLRPVMTFDWHVFGPYDSAQWRDIVARFRKRVFATPEGRLYDLGHGYKITWCDTTWVIGPPNQLVLTCHDMLIDTVQTANRFGWLDTLLDLSSPDFASDSALNRIVTSASPTSTDTAVAIFDLFRQAPHDTTLSGLFIFWIRARDADDTSLFDPTPAYYQFEVYDPKFENGILIADAGIGYSINNRNKQKADEYWQRAIANWNDSIHIDTLTIGQSSGNSLPFLDLLRHRVVVFTNDDVFMGVTTSSPIPLNLQKAMGAGLNVWLCGRNQLTGQEGSAPSLFIGFSSTVGSMFGLVSTQYSGWQFYIENSALRIEDFVGATAVNPTAWPDLVIDSALLHDDYAWSTYPFELWLVALPEVNHVIPAAGAEVLYSYKSRYAEKHPLLSAGAFQSGKPVVTRHDRGVDRVVVSAFTPYAFDDATSPTSSMQVVVDSIMNWLFFEGSRR